MYFLIAGRSLCDWSSCQEGCTKTVYTCWKIIVEYEVPGINPGDHLETPVASGKLFPNVKVSFEMNTTLPNPTEKSRYRNEGLFRDFPPLCD